MQWPRHPTVRRTHVAKVALCLVLAVAGGSCTLLGGGKGGGAKEKQESDEAGVKRISQSLKDFREALRKRDFDYATKYLRAALNQTRNASEITRGHPEFEDLEMEVEEARERLDRAIEQDRIERRRALIADLIQRGEAVMAQANRLYASLNQRVATQQDVDQLDAVLAQLMDLEAEGLVYIDDQRYTAHAQERDSGIPALRKLRDTSLALMDVAKRIEIDVHTAVSAAAQGNASGDLDERTRQFARSGRAFEGCVASFGALKAQGTYDALRAIKTRMGELSMGDTEKKCAQGVKLVRQQVAQLEWYQQANASVQELDGALRALRGSQDATAELEQARRALDALRTCATDLGKSSKHPGFNRQHAFDTPLGKLPANKLAKACGQEQQRITKSLPQIEWRTTLASLSEMVQRAVELRQSAQAAATGADRAASLEQAIDGLAQCAAEAKRLGGKRGADRKHELVTPLGKLTVPALAKVCLDNQKAVQKDLAAAVKQREAEGFAKDAKGDERDVIAREGVPTRIEKVPGGRVFVYERLGPRGAKRGKRIGFDDKGTLVDYEARWRAELDRTLANVERVLTSIKEAKTAAEELAAVTAARPVLTACADTLRASASQPGYDPNGIIDSALGKLNPDGLVKACLRKESALQGRATALAWRAELEGLRDTIDALHARVRALPNIADPSARIADITTLAGELQGCLDHSEKLKGQPAAEPEYEVPSAYGVINLGGANSACELMFDEVVTAGEKAAMDKEIAEFAKGCKGDEVAVVWREGIPSKVVTFGNKRIFVYEKGRGRTKSTSKRYPFDAQGKRMSEVELLADLSIEPELEELPMPELVPPVKRRPKK